MSWRLWGQMAGIEDQAVRTILWLIRPGPAGLRHPTAPWAGAHGGPQLSGQVTLQILVGMENLDTALGLKGLFPISPPAATFALYYVWGLGPKAQMEAQRPPVGRKKRQGKKHLSVPSLHS